VNPTGPVDDGYHNGLGDIYQQYRSAFASNYSEQPSTLADLSASGVYLLLHDVLPAALSTSSDLTADSIRQAALALDEPGTTGLLAGGIGFDTDGLNRYAAIIVRQQQGSHFCSIWPLDIATCLTPLLEFPTWRARALQQESKGCGAEL
jgi:hypothetical protein